MWTFLTAVISCVGTLVLVLIARNLSSSEKKLSHRVDHKFGAEDPRFRRTMASLLGPPIVPGNRIVPLVNGDRIFPAVLGAIRGARKTITLETFIYWSGKIGEEVAEALAERAKAGVRVHVLLDWLGSKQIDEKYVEEMERAGVQVERYHPIRWRVLGKVNHRTHRKILVVDGRIGFTGGLGIADKWTGDGQDPDHWRDTHYLLEGPAVGQMQAAFMDNWTQTHAEVLYGDDYFPQLEKAGECPAQVFKSSPREGGQSMRLMYLLSIASATKTIDLGSAYFVPDDLAVEELVDARKRGVRVRILVPGKYIDTHIVRRASRSRWGALLEAGCEIHEYQPTMYHCKLLIVDGVWTSVGSTNFDNRSFRLNDEVNLSVTDPGFAAGETVQFERDLRGARRITLEEWRRRPWTEKVIEHAAGLLRGQL
jgi:cardiolipin synthase